MSLEIGSVVEGVVTGITNFGAFVKLPEGNTGLIHISEVANTYVKDVHEFINEKDKVKVKILGINNKGKYDLSLKQVAQDTGEEIQPEYSGEQHEMQVDKEIEPIEPQQDERRHEREPREYHEPRGAGRGEGRGEGPPPRPRYQDKRHGGRDHHGDRGYTFEDKLTRYLKESEERLLDLKRSNEAKRGKKR